ncbi:MAG: magnesium transporter [Chlamydiota bacterium]|nr:magnesium transporter [Chlamydiota bacterium]
MKHKEPLLPLVQKYVEQNPHTVAHSLETMDEEDAIELLKVLPPSLASKIFQNLHDVYAADLLQALPQHHLEKIVSELNLQQVANIFLHINDDTRSLFLNGLDEKKKRKVQELLTYPEDSAGRIMTLDFIAFHSDTKVKDAVQKIRRLAQKGSAASYVYVVDINDCIVGVMNMRDMLLAPPDVALESVMRKEIFTVNCFMDREKIAHDLSERHYFAAPVVDNENRLLGIIKAEQLIADVQEEATEDIQKMFGAGGDERSFSTIGFSLRKRLPWLHVNLITAFLAASVVALFEDVIAKITVLAVYLPVVAGQGGNAGAQSLAVVMRGLVMREIPFKKARKLILKESLIGFINGIVIGIVTGLVAWFWQGNPFLGIVIGLGMLVNLTAAGMSGAAIPLFMKSVGLDPAQCSNIILTTITDVMGFFSFLGFAVLFQDYLV